MLEQMVLCVEKELEILDDNQENINFFEKVLKLMILKGKELRKVLEIKKSYLDIRIEDLNFDLFF